MVKLFGELVSAFSWEVWSWRSSSSFAPWQVRPNDSYALLQKNTPNGKWKNFNNACESGDGRFVTVSSKTRESRKVVKLVIEQEALQNRHNADPDLNGQWQVGPFFAVISVFWILQLFFQLSYLTHMQTASMWPFHQLSCLSFVMQTEGEVRDMTEEEKKKAPDGSFTLASLRFFMLHTSSFLSFYVPSSDWWFGWNVHRVPSALLSQFWLLGTSIIPAFIKIVLTCIIAQKSNEKIWSFEGLLLVYSVSFIWGSCLLNWKWMIMPLSNVTVICAGWDNKIEETVLWCTGMENHQDQAVACWHLLSLHTCELFSGKVTMFL